MDSCVCWSVCRETQAIIWFNECDGFTKYFDGEKELVPRPGVKSELTMEECFVGFVAREWLMARNGNTSNLKADMKNQS